MNYYEKSEIMGKTLEVIGIVLLILGIIIKYRVNRRRYNRRGKPVQRVPYERKLLSNMGEEFTVFLSIFFIMIGILMFVFGWFVNNDSKAELQQQHHKTIR